MTRSPRGPEIGREIANARFQSRLSDPHHVVIGRDAGGPSERQRDHGAAGSHEGRHALGDLGEREGRDDHRAHEIFARRVGISAFELGLVRIGDPVNEEVDPAEAVRHGIDGSIHRFELFDIARDHQFGPEALGQGLHALAKGLALVGERQFGAFRRQRLGDAPGDGMIVGHSHNEPALAAHEPGLGRPGLFRHRILRHVKDPDAGRPGKRWCRRSRSRSTGPCRV